MKTQNTMTATVNNMKHSITTQDVDGNNMYIDIRLSDDCKNGHNDFAITGTIYQKGKPKTDQYMIGGGCIHDEIIAAHPELKIFVDLHLSDVNGAPMYALENGFYHLNNSSKDVVMNYLRVNEHEYNALLTAKDSLYFAFLLFQLEIPARWKAEANKAIKMLEEMTGQSFEDNSVKSNLTQLTQEQFLDMQVKVSSGYYNESAIEIREEQKAANKKQALIDKLIADRNKAVQALTDECDIKIYILNHNLPIDNFIYYKHTNKGVFNWQNSSYNSMISENDFNYFVENLDYSQLPKDIKFSLGK